MSVINNHCSCGTHRHFNKGHNIVGVKLLRRCLPPVFCSLPFFLRGGGFCTQAIFLCSSSRQATKERSEQQKMALTTGRSILHYSLLSDHMEAASPK